MICKQCDSDFTVCSTASISRIHALVLSNDANRDCHIFCVIKMYREWGKSFLNHARLLFHVYFTMETLF